MRGLAAARFDSGRYDGAMSVSSVAFVLLSFSFSSALATSIKVKLDGQTSYQVERKNDEFRYTDQTYDQRIEIRECNKALFSYFWKRFDQELQSQKIKSTKGIEYSVDGVTAHVLSFEPFAKFLRGIPSQVQLLSVQSIRRCKNKS